jgi:hypothetical protein
LLFQLVEREWCAHDLPGRADLEGGEEFVFDYRKLENNHVITGTPEVILSSMDLS